MKTLYLLMTCLLASLAQAETFDDQFSVPLGEKAPDGQYHQVPDWSKVPDGEMGAAIKRGYSLFVNTQQLKGQGQPNNALQCSNCHLGSGIIAGASPLWGAYPAYPAYRKKNNKVNTYEDRLQGCFLFSMNAKGGEPPAYDSQAIRDLVAYSYWLASGAAISDKLPGRNFFAVAEPAKAPDFQRGQAVYVERCADCHGASGEGKQVAGRHVFPPLWGKESYNWGAGMHGIDKAAAFIKSNMPLSQGGSLSDQQAWDVSFYINSQERPQDPRFKGDLGQTTKEYHGKYSQYGLASPVDGHLLGSKAY